MRSEMRKCTKSPQHVLMSKAPDGETTAPACRHEGKGRPGTCCYDGANTCGQDEGHSRSLVTKLGPAGRSPSGCRFFSKLYRWGLLACSSVRCSSVRCVSLWSGPACRVVAMLGGVARMLGSVVPRVQASFAPSSLPCSGRTSSCTARPWTTRSRWPADMQLRPPQVDVEALSLLEVLSNWPSAPSSSGLMFRRSGVRQVRQRLWQSFYPIVTLQGPTLDGIGRQTRMRASPAASMAATSAPTAPWRHASACGASTQRAARLCGSCDFGFEIILRAAACGICGTAQFAATTGVAPTRGVASGHSGVGCDRHRHPLQFPRTKSHIHDHDSLCESNPSSVFTTVPLSPWPVVRRRTTCRQGRAEFVYHPSF